MGEYRPNPYHNWTHAVGVFQMVYRMLRAPSIQRICDKRMAFALMVSALVHDIAHPGNDNGFEVKTRSSLALTYSDRSVLERMHAAVTSRIILNPGTDVFRGLSSKSFTSMRQYIISAILGTDMTTHSKMLGDINGLVEQLKNSSTSAGDYGGGGFDAAGSPSPPHRCSSPVGGALGISSLTQEERNTVGIFMLHCCDISGQTYPASLAARWDVMVLDEFAAQVTRERELGIPVTPHMDGLDDESHRAHVQKSFVQYVVQPAWSALTQIASELEEVVSMNISENLKRHTKDQEQKKRY